MLTPLNNAWCRACPELVIWMACLCLVGGCATNKSASELPPVAAEPVVTSSADLAESRSVSGGPPVAAGAPVAEVDAASTTSAEGADLVAAEPVAVNPVANVDPVSMSSSGDSAPVTAAPAVVVGAESGEVVGPVPLLPQIDPCRQFDAAHDSWLDRNQVRVYRTVCGATAWFDGFFGDRRFDQATGATYGRISGGGYWDELNGWDSRIRFRARFALPALRERGSLLIGRGSEKDLIDERNTSGGVATPDTLGTAEEDSTFIGFGFDQIKRLASGLNFSVGAKLDFPPELIAKVKYRHAWQVSDRDLIRLRPIAYWKSEEGLGTTVNFDLDHVISNNLLFRWANFGNVSQYEEVDGVDWGTTFYVFQALSKKRALTYSIFAQGETNAEVTFKNAGFQLRYRQRILRDWLFIETWGGVGWPRELLIQEREANPGIGLRLEAFFGPAPDSYMQ